MCHFKPGFPEDEMLPRSTPRLNWAIPVDILALGANLEAYWNTMTQVNTLRLCHRFRPGPLSKIPQEILETIVHEVHQLERSQTQPSWKKLFKCFEGRCHFVDHYDSYGPHTEELWMELYKNDFEGYEEFTEAEKVEMVRKGTGDHSAVDFVDVYDLHDDALDLSLSAVCLCDPALEGSSWSGRFEVTKHILRSHFGLEIYLMHEEIPFQITRDMSSGLVKTWHYTSAFLTLPDDNAPFSVVSGNGTSRRHRAFLPDDGLGFRKPIDLGSLALSNDQRKRFIRATKFLGLSPQYHVTELASLLSKGGPYDSLWRVLRSKFPEWPEMSEVALGNRRELLDTYINEMSNELAKQSWPQLTLLAASDLVHPEGL